MLHFEVSVWPLIVVALVNFVFSWIWYSPLMFVKPWSKALGWSEKKEMTEAEKKAMPFLFLNGIVTSFMLSYALQIFVHSVGAKDFLSGLIVGVLLWAGFTLTGSLSTMWEGRKGIVLTINNGLYLVTYAVFGGVVAIWS